MRQDHCLNSSKAERKKGDSSDSEVELYLETMFAILIKNGVTYKNETRAIGCQNMTTARLNAWWRCVGSIAIENTLKLEV